MSAATVTATRDQTDRGAGAKRRHGGRRQRRIDLTVGLILAIMILVGLFPYVFMLLTSFKSNGQFYDSYWAPTTPLHLHNYATAWNQIKPYFLTSVIVAAGATVGSVALATTTSFVLARYRFPGRNLLFALIAVLMMVPGIASLIPQFILVRNLHLLNTRWVLMLPAIAGGSILATILIKTFVEQLPHELFEAAAMDGASGPRMFFSIMLPLARPIIGTVALMNVIGVWSEYFWPELTITTNSLRTIPVGLQFFQGQNSTNWGPMFAGFVLASLPLLFLFTFLSKYFLSGLQGGIPGTQD